MREISQPDIKREETGSSSQGGLYSTSAEDGFKTLKNMIKMIFWMAR